MDFARPEAGGEVTRESFTTDIVATWLGENTVAQPAPVPMMRAPMDVEIFQASRWTRGNFLFPTVIEVTDKAVIRRKRSWFSRDEISIAMSKVASVHIKIGMIWSDIRIESSGGSDPLASHGHRKADALRIRDLVETAQALPANRPLTS